jgi:hypothetical protein
MMPYVFRGRFVFLLIMMLRHTFGTSDQKESGRSVLVYYFSSLP